MIKRYKCKKHNYLHRINMRVEDAPLIAENMLIVIAKKSDHHKINRLTKYYEHT